MPRHHTVMLLSESTPEQVKRVNKRLNQPRLMSNIKAQRLKDEVVSNNSTSTRGSYANFNPKDETINRTKYYLDLRHKVRRSYKDFLPTCQTLQQREANTKFKFGFIPLGELKLPQEVSVSHSSLGPYQLHQKIKNSGENNFMRSQIMLDSQLNPDAWDKYLQGYWDKQLPLWLRFGFPLDFNREAQLVSHSDNHSSVKAYPNDIGGLGGVAVRVLASNL